MGSWRIVYSCPDCGDDLEDDDGLFWCPICEHLWSPAEFDTDPPEYQYPETDDE